MVRYLGEDGGAHVGVRDADGVHPLPVGSVAHLLAGDLAHWKALLAQAGSAQAASGETGEVRLLPPVDGDTEVWAAATVPIGPETLCGANGM